MTSANATSINTENPVQLTAEGLALLAAKRGPCATFVVPGHHPGSPDGFQLVRLRSLAKAAKSSLDGMLADMADQLLDPVEDFAANTLRGGDPGFVVYRTLDSLTWVRQPGEIAKSVVASHPYVMPLLEDTFSANDLFVACLSTKHLKLYEYVDGTCKTVPLPAGIPENVAAAGHADTGGGPGQNRTPAGNTVGKMTGVRFGTSGSRESARGAMEHYFTLVDRGLASLIGERPLLLMGVREEIAAYRRVSHCHSLLHAEVDGNMETLTAAQIANLAKAAALDDYRRQGEETLHQFHEMRDRQRTSRDAREILVAAAEGRVHQLCVRAGTELVEPMEEGLDRAHLPGEDLINAAVAETLAKGRSVFLLPQDRMPVNESLCAILRY